MSLHKNIDQNLVIVKDERVELLDVDVPLNKRYDYMNHHHQRLAVPQDIIGNFSVYCRISHEWEFISMLVKKILNEKSENLCLEFMAFAAQFYPEYNWKTIYDPCDPILSVVTECQNHDMHFDQQGVLAFNYGEEFITNHNLDNQRLYALKFGEIVSNFMIRYIRCSLIGFQKQKLIITSHSDCDKRFLSYLCNGYSLYRKSKVGYIKTNDESKKVAPWFDGYFYELPILPTKDIGVEFEEIIEQPNGTFMKYESNEKEKQLTKSMIN